MAFTIALLKEMGILASLPYLQLQLLQNQGLTCLKIRKSQVVHVCYSRQTYHGPHTGEAVAIS